MCTYFWWPMLYTYLLLVTYSVHTEVFKGLFSTSQCLIYSVHIFVCTSVIFTSFFVYFVLLGKLIFTWHIYYLHVLLMTYSVQKRLFNGLFCTHTTTCLSKFSFNGIFSIFSSPYRDIGPAVRVFANGPGDLGSIPGRVIRKTLKMELDTTLLNTQHYKVRFKGKVEQSWEWSSALPYTLV